MTHLDTTIKAFTKALQEEVGKAVVIQGTKNIASWMNTLEKAEFRGAKVIHENLGKLKSLLTADELDGPAIGKLLHTLGEETVRAAGQAKGSQGEEVKQLGELLLKASAKK